MQSRIFRGWALLALGIAVWGCSEPRFRKVHTEHLGQLTGTVLNPTRPDGITGTDLGVSFVEPARSKRLLFLFGDSWTSDHQRWDQDSAAWTFSFLVPDRNKLPRVQWLAGDQFTPIRIPGEALGGMNVPVEGLAIRDKIYIFASEGFDPKTDRHCCSVLAHTEGMAPDFDGLIKDRKVHSDKFINISAFVEGETVWLFGSGPYRKSAVYLARADVSRIEDRGSWQYFRGRNGSGGDFGPGEESAQPVVQADCVGELSVRPHPSLGYFMLYNCDLELGAPRGVHFRAADKPWGPWDPPITIFDPGKDRGYGHFMHQKAKEVGYDDGLAEPGLHTNVGSPDRDCNGFGWREECWGGEYGPYLIPQWFSTTPDGGISIVYTLSTWVPYQVHLMRTVLAPRDNQGPQPPPQRGLDLPPARLQNPGFTQGLAGWQSLGDPFSVFQRNGRSFVTTFTPQKGDAAMGAIFQDFTVDASTKALRFLVHGGEGTVRLHRGAEIVRETRGRSGHEPRNDPETRVCWQLEDYAGETLRVAIFDGKTGPWGFIGATDFEFLKSPCPGPGW